MPEIDRCGLVVHVDGEPTLVLNPWVATHPRDWTPAQAATIWGQASQQHPAQTGMLRRAR